MRLEPITLRGRHVSLEPLARHHAAPLVAAADRDRSTYGYTAVPADEAAMTQYIDGLLADHERGTALPFAQVRDGLPVGCTRYLNVLWTAGRATPVELEVGGTWLAGDAQRTPVNTEAKLLLLSYAFEQLDVEFPVGWSLNATNIVAQKYFRGTVGTPERESSLRQVIDRVADTITTWGT
mgnify:CR=1 FL=1